MNFILYHICYIQRCFVQFFALKCEIYLDFYLGEETH